MFTPRLIPKPRVMFVFEINRNFRKFALISDSDNQKNRAWIQKV